MQKSHPIFSDARAILLARILILILLPFSLGAFVMPHTQPVYVNSLDAPSATPDLGPGGSHLSAYSFTYSGSNPVSPDSLNSIFPFARYVNFPPFVMIDQVQVCFAENGSRVVFNNGTRRDANISWTVRFDNETIQMRPGFAACTEVKTLNAHSSVWTPTLHSTLSESERASLSAFEHTASAYLRVVMDYGVLQGVAMIPAFFLIIYYPAAGILKKLKEGLMAQ